MHLGEQGPAHKELAKEKGQGCGQGAEEKNQGLWARGRPQTSTVGPLDGKKERLPISSRVNYKNQSRHKSLKIHPQEGTRKVKQINFHRDREEKKQKQKTLR